MNAAQGTTLPTPALAYGQSTSRRVGQVTIRITNNSLFEGNYLLVVEHGGFRCDKWVAQLPTQADARALANEWRALFIGGAHPDDVTRPDTLARVAVAIRPLSEASMKALLAGGLNPTSTVTITREHTPRTMASLAAPGRGYAVKIDATTYKISETGVVAARAQMLRLAVDDPAQHARLAGYVELHRQVYGKPVMPVAAEPAARELAAVA
jgi:hypothetical protein